MPGWHTTAEAYDLVGAGRATAKVMIDLQSESDPAV
jgi:hypothetical protein